MKRKLARMMACFVFSLLAGAAGGIGQEKKPDAASTIRVDVELVSFHVAVSDSAGHFIPDMKQEQFRIFEDGVEQTISHFSPIDQPFDVVLALDTSGSMREKLWRIQEESIRFLDLLHPDDAVAVVSFDEEVRLESDFSSNRRTIVRGIKSTRTGQATQVYEAVYVTIDNLLRPRDARKALVLFSDGVDTSSRTTSARDTLRLAEEADVLIYPIKFNTLNDLRYGRGRRRPGVTVGPGVQVPLPFPTPGGGIGGVGGGGSDREYQQAGAYLHQLAERTGGRVFDADTIDDLGRAYEQVADDLRHQYSIGYVSTNPAHDGRFRRVKVSVSEKSAVVRARKGYYAPRR